MSIDVVTPREPEQDPWTRAQKYWDGVAVTHPEVGKGLDALVRYRETCKKPEKENAPMTLLVAMTGDKEAAEHATYPRNPERKMWGALPHFGERDEVVGYFPEEASYFEKHYTPGKGPEWRDSFYAGRALLFELKFGKRLSQFAEEILALYPKRDGQKGKEINIFGLSGSGKSTAVAILKEQMGDRVLVLDSDTVRYNLLAKMIQDVELAHGTDMKEIRDECMHNAISGALYFLLEYVAKELKERGYTVIKSSTLSNEGADATIYIEHPDGIDPRGVSDTQIPAMAKQLFGRTQSRLSEKDNYDWAHAKTVTDFNAMQPVTVQVPEQVHGNFVKNIREALAKDPSIQILLNPKIDDANERNAALRKKLQEILQSTGIS
ncbi:MAG: hypothetical protein Q7S16_01410 [bacterium]|nr:hypothetical protein [bacterium]